MADRQLVSVTAASTVATTDSLVINQGGAVKQATAAKLPISDAQALANQQLTQSINQVATSTVNLGNISPGTGGTLLDPNKVANITVDGVSRTLPNTLIYLAQKAAAGNTGSPTAPVSTAAPSLTFTGGSGDVGENATYARGTWVVDLTLTGTPGNGATSATLASNWTGTSTTYTAVFDGGQSKTVTLTNGATTCTWSGGLSGAATGSNLRVTLAVGGSGIITQFNLQTVINGSTASGSGSVTTTNISNGASIAIPTEAGVSPRAFAVIETAVYGGSSTKTATSATYTINPPGVPVNSVAPNITPTSANDTNTLLGNSGTYTVNGSTVANSTLTFAYRWTADWTLTGSLSGATSANLSSAWLGSTGTYTVIFSDGSTKSVTLTNASAAFSWSGAVTATNAIKVQLATTQSLALNANNVGHVMRYYETATGPGGAGSEVQASNTVTPTSSGGQLASGHLFLESMTGEWSEYQTARSSFFVASSGYTKADAQALVASIPTSGGTTLSASATAAQINSALAANSVVFLSGGSYTISSMIDIPVGKKLIGVAGQTINLNCGSIGDPGYGMRWQANAMCVNVNIIRPQGLGIWFDGSGSFGYKVSCQQVGYPGAVTTRYGIAFHGGGSGSCFNVTLVSCEAVNSQGNTTGGGDADGFDIGTNHGGNWQLLDCHSWRNTDDGFDCWDTDASCLLYKCSAGSNAKNPDATSQGNGTGFKLGRAVVAVSHYLYKPVTNDNADWAINYNGNDGPHYIYQPTLVGDDTGTYAYGAQASKYVIT